MSKKEAILGIEIGNDDYAFSIILGRNAIPVKYFQTWDLSHEEIIKKIGNDFKQVIDNNDINEIIVREKDKVKFYEIVGAMKSVAHNRGLKIKYSKDFSNFFDIYFQGMNEKEYINLNNLKNYCIDNFGNYLNKKIKRIAIVEMVNEATGLSLSRSDFTVARSIATGLCHLI